jgi:hypothetical protein
MKMIIKKFDENLSMKANKNMLSHSFKEFEIAYMRRDDTWDEINLILEDLEAKILDRHDSLIES